MIKQSITAHHEMVNQIAKNNIKTIERISREILNCVQRGGKIIVCGNGGSCADSSHFVAELNPLGIPAIALSDPATITAIGNDIGFASIFDKQIEALAKPGDIVIGISTSGDSLNVIHAMIQAKKMGVLTIALTGMCGRLSETVDISLTILSNDTPRIQEGYMLAGHIICEKIKEELGRES